MDRCTGGAAFLALVLSLSLGACGGGSSASAPQTTDDGAVAPTAVQGVSTPTSVSVVTAKNAN